MWELKLYAMRNLNYLLGIIMIGQFSCQHSSTSEQIDNSDQYLFELLSPAQSGVTFNNTIISDDTMNILEYNYFYNGGGVAAGDVNGDQRIDLFFTGNQVSSELFLNQGDISFHKVTQEAGLDTENWATGVSIVDINDDGRLDLYVCMSGYPDPHRRKNRLFINLGNNEENIPIFNDYSESWGIADTGYSTQAAFLDFDLDGDLDVYVLNTWNDKVNPNLPKTRIVDGTASSNDKLYENLGMNEKGEIQFVEISKQAGILYEGFGLGLKVSDINRDGWPDIYVANDFLSNDLIYINNKDGTFSEQSKALMPHTSKFSMGVDIADFNNDQLPDVMVLDMLPPDNYRQKLMNTMMRYDLYELAISRGYTSQFSRNVLQLNRGNTSEGVPVFSDISFMVGVEDTDWSWNVEFADMDNNGQKDILITNGIPKDITDSDFISYRYNETKGDFSYQEVKQKLLNWVEDMDPVYVSNYSFSNQGSLHFQNITKEWGLQRPSFSNGAISVDLDNDGDLEWVCNNINEAAYIWENKLEELDGNRHFLKLRFIGSEGNRWGIGTKVEVIQHEQIQYYEYQSVSGFQTSRLSELHIGLGEDSLVEQLNVYWPNGAITQRKNVPSDQLIELTIEEASLDIEKPETKRSVWLENVTNTHELDTFKHVENTFNDFRYEPLLPHKNSSFGPCIAVGDVNNDQKDDFYIGGAAGIAGSLFIQQPSGTFQVQTFPDEDFEDMGALFFDADLDGDVDLYVSSGGNEYNPNTAAYKDRFYRNTGDGTFERDRNAVPDLYVSSSCVRAADFDKDGDLDVFVGGRLTPGSYPSPSKSYLLENENGIFKDVTSEWMPDAVQLGMVTDAIWTDINLDGGVDLIVVGEWMSIRVFKQQSQPLNLMDVTDSWISNNSAGWWNSIQAADIDRDGDTDYILGNLGHNTRFQASNQQPMQIVAKDFDQNQTIDAIISQFSVGRDGTEKIFPIPTRDEFLAQLAYKKRLFPSYSDYASASHDQIWGQDELQNAYIRKVHILSSSIMINESNETFSVHSLPKMAQISPIYGAICTDLSGNLYPDIMLVGNYFDSELVGGPRDAGMGVLLTNSHGKLNTVAHESSGFVVRGDARGIARLRLGSNEHAWLVVQNSGPLQLYTLHSSHAIKYYERIYPYYFDPDMNDFQLIIHLTSGEQIKMELYYGSGYLSQSTRRVYLPSNVEKLEVIDYQGNNRKGSWKLVRDPLQ